jgi:hypothetical protein
MAGKSYLRLILITATVSIGALLYFFIDARYTNFFPHCPFNTLTGLYCPGCGSQRAVSALLHGSLLQAMQYNILFVLSLPVVGYSAVVNVLNTFRKETIQQRLFYSPLFVKLVLAGVILFWIARNINMFPFTLLAPHS